MTNKTCTISLSEQEWAIVANVQTMMYGLKTTQAIRFIINDWFRQQPPLPQQPQQNQLPLISD